MFIKYLFLALFGIAFGHVEGVVVHYLRLATGITHINSNKVILSEIPSILKIIEITREAATLIMLIAIAVVTSSTFLEGFINFLWVFAFWDLAYYGSLYITSRWPKSLMEIDVLFLIPRSWIAPVWIPIFVSSLTIIIIGMLLVLGAFPCM
ncbi:MAG TPA: hypothetical protein ENG70_00125 [Candidatus Cloacimonetes bacterium]|nr:hypothetical protein [Candidatus Cloacimonadota bacterium]HEX37262.1 hypothetical protein [Candidatus Cloacimonadota bacterium]